MSLGPRPTQILELPTKSQDSLAVMSRHAEGSAKVLWKVLCLTIIHEFYEVCWSSRYLEDSFWNKPRKNNDIVSDDYENLISSSSKFSIMFHPMWALRKVDFRVIPPRRSIFQGLSRGKWIFHVSSALRFQVPISQPTELPRKFRDQIRGAEPSNRKWMSN